MKILIAEDDVIPRRLLESILRKWEYEVVVAGNGEEAWEILQGPDAPKLAIFDWLMPGIDGLELCRRIRQRPDAPYIYIILLTSKEKKEDVIAGMEAGADDYLIKPVDFYRLEVRLRAGRRILDLQAQLLDSARELAQVRDREVEMGGKIQRTLLLGQPPKGLQGIEVAALTAPSQQVDGDFYDFFPHNDQCLDVVIGDVMGKGVTAALFAAATKSHFLRAFSHLAASLDRGALPQPEDIVAEVHAAVTSQFIGLESFETLCYARFDLEQGEITFVDCGHTATIQWQQRTGQCSTLQGGNMPLGFAESEVYEQFACPFEPGDLFLFYSDGVTEAQNAGGEMFGMTRLLQTVRDGSHLSPDALTLSVRRAVEAFCGRDTFGDDLTCVAVKIEPAPVESPFVEGEPQEQAGLEVAADLSELTSIWAFVREFCQRLALPVLNENGIFQLELAVVEAASNIIKHAYHGQENGRIQIKALAFSNRVEVQMFDNGNPFNPDTAKPPSFDGSVEGGFGLYIISQSVDEVQYTRDAQGRNCTRLVQKEKDPALREPYILDTEE